MRILATSDIHIDYQDNRKWIEDLSDQEFVNDVLILAGDISDDLALIRSCFQHLSKKFFKVMYVTGNHELWVARDGIANSFEKYDKVCAVAKETGILLEPLHLERVSIVPLFGWYDFSFGQPTNDLMEGWMDFHACSWPDNYNPFTINQHFLNKNRANLALTNETLISFSHFVPRIDLLPSYIPEKYRFLNPVLGSVLLEKQIRELNPDIHVYGHSHVNRNLTIDGIQYINNAFGYPAEMRSTKKSLLCVHEV